MASKTAADFQNPRRFLFRLALFMSGLPTPAESRENSFSRGIAKHNNLRVIRNKGYRVYLRPLFPRTLSAFSAYPAYIGGANMNYKTPQPYPNIPPQPSFPAAIRQLLPLYAGELGELTAVTQYFYNHLIASELIAPEIADAFQQASLTEMRHLDVLGRLILAYGGDPKLVSYAPSGRQLEFWSSRYLVYPKTLGDMLKYAAIGEEKAIYQYEQTKQRLNLPLVTQVIDRILLDERAHLDEWDRLLQTL